MESLSIPVLAIIAIIIPTVIMIAVYQLYIMPKKLQEAKLSSGNNNKEKENIKRLEEQIAILKLNNQKLYAITEEYNIEELSNKTNKLRNILQNIPDISAAQNNEECFTMLNNFLSEHIFKEYKEYDYSQYSPKLKQCIDAYWNIIDLRKMMYDVSRYLESQGEPPLSTENYTKNIETLLNIATTCFGTMKTQIVSEEEKQKLAQVIKDITQR